MKVLVINCHTANRGDEAAVKAMIDEISEKYPGVSIVLAMRGKTFYPDLPENVVSVKQAIVKEKGDYKYWIARLTKGKVALGRTYNTFVKAVREADIVLHAPGGPSIGDIYFESEKSYLYIYDLLRIMKKPYMFYAPSMGPFQKKERNKWRERVLRNAEAVILRDPISAGYVREFIPDVHVYQTLDSAIQHDIDLLKNEKKLDEYSELNSFLKKYKKCIGMTITDLAWHPVWSKDAKVSCIIETTFKKFIDTCVSNDYGIVFIPQLYGSADDYHLMKKYCTDDSHFFVMPSDDERYDSYFQQYVIGKLYAVIGMRYHSNIFSAKVGTPFISVSYEQKMQGFMEKMEIMQYCVPLKELTVENLKERFDLLEKNYEEYRGVLHHKHNDMKKESYKTTEIFCDVISRLMGE